MEARMNCVAIRMETRTAILALPHSFAGRWLGFGATECIESDQQMQMSYIVWIPINVTGCTHFQPDINGVQRSRRILDAIRSSGDTKNESPTSVKVR